MKCDTLSGRKDQANGFFQGVGFSHWGFLSQRETNPTSGGLIHWGQHILWCSILNIVSLVEIRGQFWGLASPEWKNCRGTTSRTHALANTYNWPSHIYLPPPPSLAEALWLQGFHFSCNRGWSLSMQLVMYYPPRYWPGTTHQLICQGLLPWPFVPEFMLLLWCTATRSWSNDKEGAAKTMENKAKLSHFTKLWWDATLLSFLQSSKYQLIKMASGTAFLTQIWKSYKKTSTLYQEDAGLNLKRPSTEMKTATWARVKMSFRDSQWKGTVPREGFINPFDAYCWSYGFRCIFRCCWCKQHLPESRNWWLVTQLSLGSFLPRYSGYL